MGFLDDLRKLTRPYSEDDEDEFDNYDEYEDEEPAPAEPAPALRAGGTDGEAKSPRLAGHGDFRDTVAGGVEGEDAKGIARIED